MRRKPRLDSAVPPQSPRPPPQTPLRLLSPGTPSSPADRPPPTHWIGLSRVAPSPHCSSYLQSKPSEPAQTFDTTAAQTTIGFAAHCIRPPQLRPVALVAPPSRAARQTA
ncbi:hypothetical protein Q7P36_001278 [Cladosporium allicinum]